MLNLKDVHQRNIEETLGTTGVSANMTDMFGIAQSTAYELNTFPERVRDNEVGMDVENVLEPMGDNNQGLRAAVDPKRSVSPITLAEEKYVGQPASLA